MKSANRYVIKALCGCLLAASGHTALGQSSSIFRQPVSAEETGGLTLRNSSFMYQMQEPPKELKIKDTIMVTVSEKSQFETKGDVDTKRKGNLNATISDWVKFKGLSVHADELVEGDPKVKGSLDSQFKSNAGLKTNDSLQFRIAAEIVDIRPNGNLVIEAHRTLIVDEEIVENWLTGVIRRQDVLPNGEVKSERIAELQLSSKHSGHIRDAYRRGWLTKIWDVVTPF